MDLHYMEIFEIATLIRDRTISSYDVVKHMLERIYRVDKTLGSFVHVDVDSALKQATSADEEISRGMYRGKLHGIPMALKDLFWRKGVRTAAGMPLHRDFMPSEDRRSQLYTRLGSAYRTL